MFRTDIDYCINKEVLLPRLTNNREYTFVDSITDNMTFRVRSLDSLFNITGVIELYNCCDKLKELFRIYEMSRFRIGYDEVIPAKKLKFMNEINNL